jgi:exopolysaccharide biosynthesis polyprenyl glycosylphosphotransferase
VTAMTTMTQLTTVASPRSQAARGLDDLAASPGHQVPWVLIADVLGALTAMLAVMALGVLPPVLVAPATVTWLLLLNVQTPGAGAQLTQHVRGVLAAGLVLGAVCWLAPLVASIPATADQVAAAAGIVVVNALGARVISVAAVAHTQVRRVVLAGSGADVGATLAEIHRAGGHKWQVVGACVDDVSRDLGLPATAVTSLDQVAESAFLLGADAVLALPSERLTPEVLRRLTWQLEGTGTDLYVGTGVVDVARTRTALSQIGGVGLLQVRPVARKGVRRMVKDVSERIACLLLVIMLLPLLIGIAIAVRLDSAGPAVFRQQRVGRDGRTFVMYKFRTMSTDAGVVRETLTDQNDCDGIIFKMRADPRVTRLGRVLRRYSLDEVPQLFNVIRGDMSLVGPRPALPQEVSRYTVDPSRRLVVKPGVTGLWQVSGRSDLSWDESVRLDIRYVDNWSLALDVAIVLRTLGAVLGHRGAY